MNRWWWWRLFMWYSGLSWPSCCKQSAPMWKILKRASGYDFVCCCELHYMWAISLLYLASLNNVGISAVWYMLLLGCFHVVHCVRLQCYMNEMMTCGGQLPPGIAGREDIVFGNIVEIHEFHKKLVDWFTLTPSSRFIHIWEYCVV